MKVKYLAYALVATTALTVLPSLAQAQVSARGHVDGSIIQENTSSDLGSAATEVGSFSAEHAPEARNVRVDGFVEGDIVTINDSRNGKAEAKIGSINAKGAVMDSSAMGFVGGDVRTMNTGSHDGEALTEIGSITLESNQQWAAGLHAEGSVRGEVVNINNGNSTSRVAVGAIKY